MPVNKKYKSRQKIISPIKQKVLSILETGLSIGMTSSVNKQIFLLKKLPRELASIDRRYLYQILNEFRYNRLVEYKETGNGQIKMILSEQGRRKVLEFNIDELEIKKPKEWDGRWRLVIFDVPEKIRKGRDALRDKLRDLGFFEWQKSAWVLPYPCRDQIDFIVEFFELRSYVRYAELTSPTNEAELKLHFDLK